MKDDEARSKTRARRRKIEVYERELNSIRVEKSKT
jgi:hypothetical protein